MSAQAVYSRVRDLTDWDHSSFGTSALFVYWNNSNGKYEAADGITTTGDGKLALAKGSTSVPSITFPAYETTVGAYFAKFTFDALGDFYLSGGPTLNYDGTTYNNVMSWGYNADVAGNRPVAARHSTTLQIESWYQPNNSGEARRWTEIHLPNIWFADSTSTRPLSFLVDVAPATPEYKQVVGMIRATQFGFLNVAGTIAGHQIWDGQRWLVYNDASNGGYISAQSNNRAWLYQINAAANANVEIARVNASDQIELAPAGGTVKTGGGNMVAPNLKTLHVFRAIDNEPPASAYATLDTRNSHAVLDFDAGTDESAIFSGILSKGYTGLGVTVILHWTATSGTSGACRWAVSFERCNTDIDSDSFATANTAGTTTNGTSGIINTTSINFANGAEMDSLAAGERFRLKVMRDADGTSGTDDMTGDAELLAVEIREQ